MTEYSGWCDTNGNNYGDWIEVYNNDSVAIDLSRWRIDTDNQRFFVTHLAQVDASDQYLISVNQTISTMLSPGDYALISLPRSTLMPIDLSLIHI